MQFNVAYPLPSSATPVTESTTSVTDGAPPISAAPTPQTNKAGCVYMLNNDPESHALGLINNACAQNGLEARRLDSRLNAVALEHSLDMACIAIISYIGTGGSTWYDQVSKQGFVNYNSAHENILVGNPDLRGNANGAFNWWKKSEIHRKTLMNPGQKLISITYVYSGTRADGGNYTTGLRILS